MIDDPIAKWYDDKRREADAIREQLVEARKRNATPKEIRALEQKLERALYVGD